MARFKLVIEYCGTGFHGWQFQPDLPTIQGEIEAAFEKFCGQKVTLFCSGRTDAGVHARGQVAHVDLEGEFEPFKIRDGVNYHLKPHAIALLHVEPVDEDFHARFSSKKRWYTYKIINRYAPLTLDHERAWQVPRPLDIKAMQEASKVLLGRHDFTTFRSTECQAKSPIKTLDLLDIVENENGLIDFHVSSQSFLHNQVRNMVGSLKIVGDGRWTKDDLERALEAKDRTQGGPTAPAHGLYFRKVDY